MLSPNRKYFFLLVGLYCFIMQGFILATEKGFESLYFCYHRQTYLTEFFKLATYLGEWISLAAISFYLLITNRRALFSALLAFVPLDLLMLSLKRALDYPRPLSYFKQGEITPIPDFTPLYAHSMPSGHTFTTFFCMTFVLFYFDLNRKWQLVLFMLAILVGISRIYLMCHFKEDVFIGSILGIIAGILAVFIYEKGVKKI